MNKKNIGAPLNASPLVSAKACAFLARHGATWFWANLSGAGLFALLHWSERDVDLTLLLIWFASVGGLSVARWLFGQRFHPAQQYSTEELQAFGQRQLVYSTLNSALWGVSGVILFSPQPLVQAVHVLLLAGAMIAAMPVLALSRFSLYIQIGTILLPITAKLLWVSGAENQALAAASVLLGVLLAMASRSIIYLLNDLDAAQLRMQEQAHTDAVTQIPNRRFFDQTFKAEWRRSARDEKQIALLMIDVDYFKRYNDQHGHHAGDQCLQIIAQCIKSVARRASDVVARHGGEEFVILLPDTSLEDALKLAERLRKHVEDQRIPHSDNALPRIVTVSVGVSCCTPMSPKAAEAARSEAIIYPAMLLNAADRALYRAKRNGRNQVAKELCGQGAAGSVLPLPPAANTITNAA